MAAWQPIGLSGGGTTTTPAISPHNPLLIIINCDMGGAYRSEDGGKTWSLIHRQDLMGCPYCAPLFHPLDPSLILAASGYHAELRHSTDSGRTWTPYGHGLPNGLRHLAIHPYRPNEMLAATLHGLFISSDGGAHWQPVNFIPSERFLALFFLGQPDRAFLATAHAVWYSKDSGATWSPLSTPFLPNKKLLAFTGAAHPTGHESLLYSWVATTPSLSGNNAPPSSELWISRDGGDSWNRSDPHGLLPPPHSRGVHRLLVSPASPSRLYAFRPFTTATNTVLRSDNAGNTWHSIAGFDQRLAPSLGESYLSAYFPSIIDWDITAAAINPTDANHLLFSHYASVFQTRNGGATWENLETILAPGQSRPITRSHRWLCNGLAVTTTWQYSISPANPNRHFIAYTDLGLARSDDAGQSWQLLRQYGPNCYAILFDPARPQRAWMALGQTHDIPNNNIVIGSHFSPDRNVGCIIRTEDNGDHFAPCINGLPPSPSTEPFDDCGFPACAGTVVSLAIDLHSPVEARTLYASLFEQGVFRSSDGGRSWHPFSEGLGVPVINMRVCRLFLHADGTLFCSITGKRENLDPHKPLIRSGVGLYRRRPDADQWEDLTQSLELYWTADFAVDPHDSRSLWLAVCDCPDRKREEGGLYHSTNGGITWQRRIRLTAWHFGLSFHPTRSGHLYMTLLNTAPDVSALWFSPDNGEHWFPFDDYPFCSAHRVFFDPRDPAHILVTTYGAGILRGPSTPS